MIQDVDVGPSVLAINRGSTMMVTDLAGQMTADDADAPPNGREVGVFRDDTRLLSHYRLTLSGRPWVLLSSGATSHDTARVYLTNPPLSTELGPLPEATVLLTIRRMVGDGIHEDLTVSNYGQATAILQLALELRSDFADLFEVKAHEVVPRGRVETEWDEGLVELTTSYTRFGFRRRFSYRVLESTSRPAYANGRIVFDLRLEPGATWTACSAYILGVGSGEGEEAPSCVGHDAMERRLRELAAEWRAITTRIASSHEALVRWYDQSVQDLGALRLETIGPASDAWVPAAGIPWFAALFGRDSLIVGLQAESVHPGFAVGALRSLARYQAVTRDDWRDAEPGKIPHEIRLGELAYFHAVPHTPYYGTADATPLYLIALHETWKWLGDDGLLREHWETAQRCLEWIDAYGDLDGDGFQEYRTRSERGYENMGWKDAGDAIVYPDGRPVLQPKALVELQGYVFDAWQRMAEACIALGETERAAALHAKAAELRERFEEHFWCEDLGTYALALDPAKEQVRTVASNPGHCLWSGIASPERARQVAGRLLAPDMWSGWGIRTLSADHPAYNPLSYQRGSVWPHDNGLIALGFKRYGLTDAVAQVARGFADAADCFTGYRLPELFAGIDRQTGAAPVPYAGASVPQAWAAGSVFHLLQALLGLRADAPNGRLDLDPSLPSWLPDVTLYGLRVGPARVDLHVWREGERTRWDASVQGATLTVRQNAWAPWTSLASIS